MHCLKNSLMNMAPFSFSLLRSFSIFLTNGVREGSVIFLEYHHFSEMGSLVGSSNKL